MFFARIMKEHAIFLEASFTPANPDFASTADAYKQNFENILQTAVDLGGFGVLDPAAVASHQFVTDFTLGSEQKVTDFTGIFISTDITRQEANLWGNQSPRITPELVESVHSLNALVLPQLDELIEFKKQIINNVVSCNMFVATFPEEGAHILEEAEHYRQHLVALMSGRSIHNQRKEQEFWNDKMKEHAEFIRGKLDITEHALFNRADQFSKIFDRLAAGNTSAAIRDTQQLASFKQSLTDNINRCRVRSFMLPLFTDHILREANHYLRVLRQG